MDNHSIVNAITMDVITHQCPDRYESVSREHASCLQSQNMLGALSKYVNIIVIGYEDFWLPFCFCKYWKNVFETVLNVTCQRATSDVGHDNCFRRNILLNHELPEWYVTGKIIWNIFCQGFLVFRRDIVLVLYLLSSNTYGKYRNSWFNEEVTPGININVKSSVEIRWSHFWNEMTNALFKIHIFQFIWIHGVLPLLCNDNVGCVLFEQLIRRHPYI